MERGRDKCTLELILLLLCGNRRRGLSEVDNSLTHSCLEISLEIADWLLILFKQQLGK